MNNRYTDLSCEFEIKSDGDNIAMFAGVASTSDVDYHNDIIAAGCFDPIPTKHAPDGKLIPDVMMLRDHERSEVIGGWHSFKQEGNRLLVEGELTLEVAKARETRALMKKGFLSGLSVGFGVKSLQDIEYDERTNRRTIKKAILRECSVVGFPANKRARVVSVKAEIADRLREYGMDETDLLLQLLLRQPKAPDKKSDGSDFEKKREDLIKAIDDFVPLDVTKAEETMRGLVAIMKGHKPCQI